MMMIGIDIVKIERIEKLIKKYPDKALKRFLYEEEITLVKSVETAAGFYAAKEAVAKALGTGIGHACSFYDIKIHKDRNGAPYFTLNKHLVEKFSIKASALSITHDGGFAVAVASVTILKHNHRELSH